jgi:hypothetical protein
MDAVGIWLLKAKAIALGNNYFKDVLYKNDYFYSHQQYPLLLPLFLSIFFKMFGFNNNNFILIFYPFLFLTIIYLAYKIFLKNNSKIVSLFMAYCFSMLPILLSQGGRGLGGNADIFLVLINILIILSIYNKKYLLLVLMCGIASQIKMEGVLTSIIILMLPERKKKKILLFLASIFPFVLWRTIVYFFKIPNDSLLYLPSMLIVFQKILILIGAIFKEMVNLKNWYLFWPIFFLLMLSKGKLSNFSKNIFLLYSILFVILLVLIFSFNTENVNVYATSTFDRMLLQITPFLFVIAGEKIKSLVS